MLSEINTRLDAIAKMTTDDRILAEISKLKKIVELPKSQMNKCCESESISLGNLPMMTFDVKE